jgi:hypothetical protein
MLDLMARLAKERKLLGRNRRRKPLGIDSSLFESRHVSRHFERRRRDTSTAKKGRGNGAKRLTAGGAAS